MWTSTLWTEGLVPLQWAVVIGASLAAAIADARYRRIPNLLTLPLLALGLLAAFAMGGVRGLADAGAASVMLALPYLLLYAVGHGGAGDVKMMAAVGAWLGIVNGIVVLFAVAVAGVALAIVWVIVHRPRPLTEVPAMPFGVAICLGICIAAPCVVFWRLGAGAGVLPSLAL